MKKILITIFVLVVCGVLLMVFMRRRKPSVPVRESTQPVSLSRQPSASLVTDVLPEPKKAEDTPRVEEMSQLAEGQSQRSDIPNQAERLRMTDEERISLLETLGQLPRDSALSDYRLAEKTTWWGTRLDAQVFWSNRVVWLDSTAQFEARRRGRGYPPIPFEDESVADRSDVDSSTTGFQIEGPNIHFVSSEREHVFWDNFVKTHPHPPQDIEDWQEDEANRWLHNKYMMDHEPEKAARFKLTAESMNRILASGLRDAETFGYPPECVAPDAYRWAHIMRKRKEYESLLASRQEQSPVAISNFFRRVYVDRKYITEPLSDEDIAVANVWKASYLKRLRAEGTDESYINAYLTAWNLDEFLSWTTSGLINAYQLNIDAGPTSVYSENAHYGHTSFLNLFSFKWTYADSGLAARDVSSITNEYGLIDTYMELSSIQYRHRFHGDTGVVYRVNTVHIFTPEAPGVSPAIIDHHTDYVKGADGWLYTPPRIILPPDAEGQIDVTILKVEIGDLQRVPIFGTDPLGSNEKSVNVTVTPSPIPGTGSVALALSTESGAGSAAFDDGSTTKTITQTTTVKVRGVTNSDIKDNIKLAAQIDGSECANDLFTVSTWPYEFRNHLQSQNDHFGLSVTMSWKSESGSLTDLGNVELREYVTYPHPGVNPPFTIHGSDPTITPTPPMPGTCGGTGYQDGHDYQPAWVDYSTSTADYMESSQDYQFRDTVLNTSWDDGVLATFTIKREVIDNPGGTYRFKTSKTGTGEFSESCTETP